MKKFIKKYLFISLFWGIQSFALAQSNSFTQQDRELLIELNKRTQQDRELLIELKTEFKTKMAEIDKRFEQIDKRFEELRMDMNSRFSDMNSFLGWLVLIFTSMTVGMGGLVYWDRKTSVIPLKENIKKISTDHATDRPKIENMLSSLRELSKKNLELADILKRFNLL